MTGSAPVRSLPPAWAAVRAPTRPERPPALEPEAPDPPPVPLFNVVLLDDDQHTYDYVIEMLQKLFMRSKTEAFRHAVEVDTTGRSIVLTAELTVAEFGRDQIQGFGPDWRMNNSKGSMRAVLEPASGPKVA